MIGLVLAMLWSRRGQALTVALLTLLGVAAAVAGPAWLRATDRAVAAGQVEVAAGPEKTFTLSQDEDDQRALVGQSRPQNLEDTRGALFGLPGFSYVSAAEFPAMGVDPDITRRTQFVYRQNVCGHLTMIEGRCLSGEGDVVVGERTAQRLKIKVGQSISMAFAVLVHADGDTFWKKNGADKPLLVSGIYRVPDPGESYWGSNGYFAAYVGAPDEPMFVLDSTLKGTDHGTTRLTVDGVAGPGALAVDRLPALQTGIATLQGQVQGLGGGIKMESGIPGLLARIDQGRRAAHLIVPVPAVALVLLSLLTIFLAVGYGTEGRRPELAVVALRGARWGQRWWLATGENLVAVLIGAIAGCVAGQLLVNAVAAIRFPGVGADPGLDSLRWAPVAALAALITALLAEWRQLLSPVSELLRRAPVVRRAVGAIAVQAAVAVLAVIATVQLFVTGGTLTGVGTFASALVAVALSQLAARAVLPTVTRYAARALGRGRPGLALAGFQLSRRPGAARIFTLVVAAVAVSAFAACAVDAAARARNVQADLGTGADRVVTVQATGRQSLLAAVRTADPAGAYAMAAIRLTTEPGQPAGLAVDSTRLAQVANWPAGDAKAAATALRPAAPEPLTVRGPTVAVDLTATGTNPAKLVTVGIVVGSPLGDEVLPLGDLQEGRHTYARNVDVCREVCRVHAIRISEGDGNRDITGTVTLNSPRAGAWRANSPAALRPDGTIDLTSVNSIQDALLLQPVSTPAVLPAVVAGAGNDDPVPGLDGKPVRIDPIAEESALPGVGTPATLIDLDYADRIATDGGASAGTQVWLNAEAPDDALNRLSAAGLVITGDVRASVVRASLDRQGPALALVFAVIIAVLAAGLAAGALVLAATVDRARRAEDLTALRAQGLSRPALRQATLWTYPALVAAAVIAGLAIGLLTWGLTGWALPLSGLSRPPLPLPGWPRPWVLAVVTVVAGAVLAAVAWLTGRRTLAAIR
ncbi:FtsX-like permease family protein [Actinoplanes sp. NPDC049265]|uniref:FtsX-like permease family protein n=1 Tax=Actinoplanes sp. NPDC049265 TaxID=3363902 RepID=UPI00371860E4